MDNRTVTCRDCGVAWVEPSKPGPPRQRCESCRKERQHKPGRARRGENRVSETEYRCTTCKQVKLLDEFHRATKSSNGRQGSCKACARDYSREHSRMLARSGAVRYRMRKYGLTPADVDAMLEAQGHRCAVCRTTDPAGRWGAFAIDHCHATGNVRGLLCYPCNTALGLIRDNPVVALALADYLFKHQPEPMAPEAMHSKKE